MTLLADLARLLRHMDPMPPRVLTDALAAGPLVARPSAQDSADRFELANTPGAADTDSPVPATAAEGPVTRPAPGADTPLPVTEAGIPVCGSAAPGVGGGTWSLPATAQAPVDSIGDAAVGERARGDWPAIPAGSLPRPRAELLVLAETIPAVRSAGRRLRIGPAGGEHLLDLEIRQLGATQRIAGLAPPNTPLTVRHEQGDHDVDVDQAGYFNVEVPSGPIRIRLHEAESGWI